MIDRRPISYTQGTPLSPVVSGTLIPTISERDIVAPPGTLISSAKPRPPPTPIDIAVDLTLGSFGAGGWALAGFLNRDKPPGMQLPFGQAGELMLMTSPAYGAYGLLVDKPEGGVSEVLAGGGGSGIIPKLPDLTPGGGSVQWFINEVGGGGGLPGLPGLPDLSGLKQYIIPALVGVAGLYLAGKWLSK